MKLVYSSLFISNRFGFTVFTSWKQNVQAYILSLDTLLKTKCSKTLTERYRDNYNHKLQPTPDTKRKRKRQTLTRAKQTNKRTRSTWTSSVFPKRGDHNAKRMKKHEDKEHGKTLKHEAPCSINHKATQNNNNIGTTALERSVSSLHHLS